MRRQQRKDRRDRHRRLGRGPAARPAPAAQARPAPAAQVRPALAAQARPAPAARVARSPQSRSGDCRAAERYRRRWWDRAILGNGERIEQHERHLDHFGRDNLLERSLHRARAGWKLHRDRSQRRGPSRLRDRPRQCHRFDAVDAQSRARPEHRAGDLHPLPIPGNAVPLARDRDRHRRLLGQRRADQGRVHGRNGGRLHLHVHPQPQRRLSGRLLPARRPQEPGDRDTRAVGARDLRRRRRRARRPT